MGSVEYLRVRINQQLQMLRHVYRDTNSEKMAIKYAKQKVINERLATQNERSKLLIAIDHNKYYWPPDSQPVGDDQEKLLLSSVAYCSNYFLSPCYRESCRYKFSGPSRISRAFERKSSNMVSYILRS